MCAENNPECREKGTRACVPMMNCRSGRRLHIAGTTSASKSMPLRGTRRLKATIVLAAWGCLQREADMSLRHANNCMLRTSAITSKWLVPTPNAGQCMTTFDCHLACATPHCHPSARHARCVALWRKVLGTDGVGDDGDAAGRDACAQHGVLLGRVRHADHLPPAMLACLHGSLQERYDRLLTTSAKRSTSVQEFCDQGAQHRYSVFSNTGHIYGMLGVC